MRPTMISVGSTTPANHGSKYTSISCSPRKYQGAFDGLGVFVGLAISSSGASMPNDHTVRKAMTAIVHRNSFLVRYGQVYTLSSVALTGIGGGCGPAGAARGVPLSGVGWASSAIVTSPHSLSVHAALHRRALLHKPGTDPLPPSHRHRDRPRLTPNCRHSATPLHTVKPSSILQRTRDTAILPDTPEMHHHQRPGEE